MAIIKKQIKFDLPIDGAKVKNLDELREHITVEVINLFRSGLLIKWLKQRNEDEILSYLLQVNNTEDDRLLFIDIVTALGEIEIDEQIVDALFEMPVKTKPSINEVKITKKDDQVINDLVEIPIERKPNIKEFKVTELHQSTINIKVPDLDGHSNVNVAEVYVTVGDRINIDDNLIMLETDKATMDISAEKAGVVVKIFVKVGSKVNSGDLIVELESLSNEEHK